MKASLIPSSHKLSKANGDYKKLKGEYEDVHRIDYLSGKRAWLSVLGSYLTEYYVAMPRPAGVRGDLIGFRSGLGMVLAPS